MNPILASSLPSKRFIDPDTYCQPFHVQAVQNALLCLRVETTWTLGDTLGTIGWRLRKSFFKISSKSSERTGNKLLSKSGFHSQSKHCPTTTSHSSSRSLDYEHYRSTDLVLEWLEYGPDKYFVDKELTDISQSLMRLEHPYIEPIILMSHNENGCLIIRKFYQHGTLKDMLCKSTPNNPFLKKYGNPRSRIAFSPKQVAKYGRQIVQALIFLHGKGYPFGHLHSGNVVILEECVRLLDIENFILGVPAFYRPFYVQHSKLNSIEAIEVYCLGHILFEMSMGYPLQESLVREVNDCPNSLKNLLESILSKDACRSALPTLEQIYNHEFFTQFLTDPDSNAFRCNFELSANAKGALGKASIKFESRLREEQKSVRNQKRIVRVQEMMSSEEGKRKNKHTLKVEHRQLKLKQQSSVQISNGCLGDKQSPLQAPNTNEGVNKEEKEPTAKTSLERQTSSPNIYCDDDLVARTALLESICKFSRGSLRKVRSND